VDIVYEHSDLVCATRTPVFVLWWRRAPTAPQVTAAVEQVARYTQATPGGIIFVVISAPDAGPPDRAASDLMARAIRTLEKHILAHAFIMEGTGIKASVLRTGVRALQSLSRVIFPWTIASSVEEGFYWLARKAKFLAEEEADVMIKDVQALFASRQGKA
jgi:hypothetical protein